MLKTKVRTITGTVVRYKKEKPSAAVCAKCGKQLHGVPRGVKKLAKSKRRPARKFGGYYCSSCSRELFKEKARVLV